MNLLERLLPKHLEMLKKDEVLYPHAIKNLCKELSDLEYWCDLKYSTVLNLIVYLRIKDYSPTSINDLFTDDENPIS
jgi:hypothetical protein